MVTMTGAEIKLFWAADWGGPDAYVNDEVIIVNGIEVNDFDPDKVDDTDIIKLSGGVVYDSVLPDRKSTASLEAIAKKWKKAQTKIFILVEADKDKETAIKEAVKKAGGRVL